MKNIRKIGLLISLLLVATFIVPILSHASTTQVSSEEELKRAINNAQNGDVIELSKDIALTTPLEITNKIITIDGNGNTISKSTESWTPNGNNGSLVTAGSPGTKLTLINITLRNAQKYGVQSYDGAYVILDGVTLTSNWYGGVLANSGSVEIKKVTLNRNGTDSNNGIEIAKGDGVYTEGTRPELIMNGTLTSSEKENVIHIDIVDPSGGFEIRNSDDTKHSIYVSDGILVITDENNDVLYESDSIGTLTVTGDPYIENIKITVRFGYKETTISVQPGTKLEKEDLIEKIDLDTLGLAEYTIDSFYVDADLTKEFDFTEAISEDTTIYAGLVSAGNNSTGTDLEQNPSTPNTDTNVGSITGNNTIDETPKTGNNIGLNVILAVLFTSVISFIVLNRKEK